MSKFIQWSLIEEITQKSSVTTLIGFGSHVEPYGT